MKNTNIAKQPLGFFPTPVTELPQLSKAIGGAKIFIKRDDLSGLAMGGNKTRKLEYLLADALSKGCDCLITAGAAQSNHCRQTAAAAAQLNLPCHLLLGGQRPSKFEGNLLLDSIFGCQIHWCGAKRKGEDIERLFKQLRSAGRKPYIVPYGGSNELGAIGFVDALIELDQQTRDEDEYSHIIFASSSGGTHAGLLVGKQLLKKNYQLVGINIDKTSSDEPNFDHAILDIANKTAKMINLKHHFGAQDLELNSNYLGAGYGVVGELEREAIMLTAKYEGILLDPVYTGRAMGGLIDMIRTGQIDNTSKVLFWHTGGTPALFAYSDDLTR